MTDYERVADTSKTLTEQWKKGELKKNKYWVKYKNGKIDTWELSEGITIESKPEIIEVLAPVPSYEEWQELKELLKECKRYIDFWGYTDSHGNFLYPQIDNAIGEKNNGY